jgi:prepilin-type N-terminal cleavage/methylation domain-containing protein
MATADLSALKTENSFGVGMVLSKQGFSLIEFMLCSLILLVVAGSVCGILSQTQRTASYQVEVQGVLEGTRYSMMTLERILQQAGNDQLNVGFPGISEMRATHVRVRADLTGSAGTGNPPDPDKGDPDGDTMDSGEDVTVNFDVNAGTVQINGQPIASNITALSMQYFDKNGGAAISGDQVTRIRITLTGQSPSADPQTGKTFSIRLASDIQLLRPAK